MNKKGRQMREKCDHSEPSPAITLLAIPRISIRRAYHQRANESWRYNNQPVLKNGDALDKSEFTVRIDEAPD